MVRKNDVKTLSGVILCGGESTRFGSDKTWHMIDGKPLIAHAVDTLTPQVDQLWLGCKTPDRRLASLGLPLICDPPGYDGPLAALAAGLTHAGQQGFGLLLSLPVDCHPLPPNLTVKLLHTLHSSGVDAAIAAQTRPDGDNRTQYAIGIWRTRLAPKAYAILAQGKRSMLALLDQTDWKCVAFERLGNINRPEDLPSS